MNCLTIVTPARAKIMSFIKAGLVSLPMLLCSALMMSGGRIPSNPLALAATISTYFYLNTLFFLMIYTGKMHRYRLILFVVTALCFVATFIPNLIRIRGNVAITAENFIEGDVPFCHIVIPSVLLPAALTKNIIFPGSLLSHPFASIAVMLVIWIGASLALGRGWCSWVCFFGGLDEGCSHLRKKAVLRVNQKKWRYLPYVVLLVIVLTSAWTMAPTYCEWLCPFKTVTEFAQVNSFKTLIQTIIFVGLFISLVVVLPALTRKRIQCGLFCPFAAFQSFTNKLNLFEVRVDRDQCTHCGYCIRQCPTFSLDQSSIESGHTLMTCSKCGSCIDQCPKKAIGFHIKGTPQEASPSLARVLYLYPAFLFAVAIGGSITAGAVYQMLQLFQH